MSRIGHIGTSVLAISGLKSTAPIYPYLYVWRKLPVMSRSINPTKYMSTYNCMHRKISKSREATFIIPRARVILALLHWTPCLLASLLVC